MSENNKKESDFWGEKASFVSAVVCLIVIFNSVWDIKNDINKNVALVEIILVLFLMYAILVKKWLDKKLDSKKARNFSTYLTVCSVIIFVLGLMEQIFQNYFWLVITYIGIILVILVGSLYLLFGKY